MEITREEIIKRVTTELDECLSTIYGEIYNYDDKILDVDMENQTISIRFNYNIVEEDNYLGLSSY